MTRCFDCRKRVPEGRFVCDACYRQKQDVLTAQAVMGRARGIHGTRGLGGAKVHMSAAERKSIERLTGIKVWDAQDARRACKMKNMRPLDKGEWLDETLQKQEAGERTEFPGWDAYGVLPKVPEFDFERRLQFHRQRLGEH